MYINKDSIIYRVYTGRATNLGRVLPVKVDDDTGLVIRLRAKEREIFIFSLYI